MKILLVLPQDTLYRYRGWLNSLIGPYAPLTLTTLAALVPEELHARVDLLDEGVQKPDHERRPDYDVVGITCVAASAPRAYELAAYWRKRGAFVVLGGFHPTMMPDDAAPHADALVLGLAEQSWPQLLRDFQAGRPQKIYRATEATVVSSPAARRDLATRRYLPIPSMVANRGCRNGCHYCAMHKMFKLRCVVRPVGEVIDEIRGLKSRHLLFLDPNFMADPEYARELFEAMVPLKVKWMAPTMSSVVYDTEMFDLMIRSGCEGVMIGFETLSKASLEESGKPDNQVEHYREIMRILHREQIVVLGAFVMGFDQDTREDMEQLVDIVDEMEVDLPRYAVLTPFPGTEIYYQLKQQGRIFSEDWSRYDGQHVVFRPQNVAPEELQELFFKTLWRTYETRRVLRRVKLSPHHKALIFLTNFGMQKATRSFMAQEERSAQS